MISPKVCSTDKSQQERHSRDLRRNTTPACSPDLSRDSGRIVLVAKTMNTITNSETKYRNQRATYSPIALILIHTVVVIIFILISLIALINIHTVVVLVFILIIVVVVEKPSQGGTPILRHQSRKAIAKGGALHF